MEIENLVFHTVRFFYLQVIFENGIFEIPNAPYAIIPKTGKIYKNLLPQSVLNLQDIDNLENAIGYISYENYSQIENILLPEIKSFCKMPSIFFGKFENAENFDISSVKSQLLPRVEWVKSNMTNMEYFTKVEKILEYIKKGTCYQVNLTRKFFGEFESVPNPLDVFAKLYSISPNPYSMLLVIGDGKSVVSSSPECFLTRNGDEIYSVPIKGSLKSSSSIANLKNFKDKSENLMITDLVRNDIGKVSQKVWVENFQKAETFSQIHHLSSKVVGKLRENITNSQCLSAIFPAGSMTGAPKIKAIQIANELEQIQRGVYSGCLGVLENSQKFDFSVVIRTIILDGKRFEFQVGGGIVFDSTPQKELEETILKAMPILETLNLGVNIFA